MYKNNLNRIMTYTKKELVRPKSIKLTHTNKINLIVHGQGVFIFLCKNQEKISKFIIYNQTYSDGLLVDFTSDKIIVIRISNNEKFIDINNTKGIINKKGAYYWFSLDSSNQKLSAGMGEARIENILYEYQMKSEDRKFMEELDKIVIDTDSNIHPLKILRDPIRNAIPLFVKGTDELTMNDVAENYYLPSANLSVVGQKLFNSISGKRFILDDLDFPEFSRAIETSINTPGLWCYNKLQEKASEFNPDKPNILETYLRITLNQNNGESPGIPYVMEIWPVGHFSPIHNHSGANAVIRVLHGSINVSLFPFLCEDKEGIESFGQINFIKDDITWISANVNQTHQLKNLETNKDTCITIQCYMYDENDVLHYDYFDFIDSDGIKQQYTPDLDMDFIDFKKLMKQEWDANKNVKKYYFV